MPQRDAFWTVQLNEATGDDSHAVHRLIDWCLSAHPDASASETQRLCAIVLTWCFASSSRPIRDRSLKALTTVLLDRPELFRSLTAMFSEVDDLYVWERLFAAAYGACCIDPDPSRLREYAELADACLFRAGVPPENLLLRDYGRGIVELAQHRGVLPKTVDIARSRPPYGSPLPRLSVTEARAESVAAAAGDTSILHSCRRFDDFGRYAIEPAVRRFLRVTRSQSAPLTAEERLARFRQEVISPWPERAAALLRLQDALRPQIIFLRKEAKDHADAPTPADRKRRAEERQRAEEALIRLLDARERRRYRREARPGLLRHHGRERSNPSAIDVQAAQRWVAKRAYELGWTARLFASETRGGYPRGPDSSRPMIERVGKKYQWLALSQLLCRLTDNYWMGGHYGDQTKVYEYPTDIPFFRDVDPTVLPPHNDEGEGQQVQLMLGIDIVVSFAREEALREWPFQRDPRADLASLIQRQAADGRKWTTLYEHRNVTTRYEAEVGLHGLRQQEFRFVYSVLVQKDHTKTLIHHLKAGRKIEVHSWDPPEFIDGPYLLEAEWRQTWPQEQWREDNSGTPPGLRISFPVLDYAWESHLDASLTKGASALLPPYWLTKALAISHDSADPGTYRDPAGEIRFLGSGHDRSAAFIESVRFQKFLDDWALQCVWLFVAERNAWPGGHNEAAAWRRTEGFAWIENGSAEVVTWNNDHVKRSSDPSRRT